MKYDKFLFSQDEAAEYNPHFLKSALEALYSTSITSESIANDRGIAIQAINRMAIALGCPEIARND